MAFFATVVRLQQNIKTILPFKRLKRQVLLNVLHRERQRLIAYFSHAKVTNKYYKTVLVKNLNHLEQHAPMQEVIKVAIEDYARKLYLEHVLKYYMYSYITAEQERLEAKFGMEDAPNEGEY